MSDTSFHDRFLAGQLADPESRTQFERERREIEAIDAIVGALDGIRGQRGMSKAELARQIGKNPASVRRTLTAPGNPELRTIVAMAEALNAEVQIVPRSTQGRHKANESANMPDTRPTDRRVQATQVALSSPRQLNAPGSVAHSASRSASSSEIVRPAARSARPSAAAASSSSVQGSSSAGASRNWLSAWGPLLCGAARAGAMAFSSAMWIAPSGRRG